MTTRLLTIHTARAVAMAILLALLAGCNSGPHQGANANSAATNDPKDGRKTEHKNSGPHQGDKESPAVGTSGPHQ